MSRILRSSARIAAQIQYESKENLYLDQPSSEDEKISQKTPRKRKPNLKKGNKPVKHETTPPKIRKRSDEEAPESPQSISKAFDRKLLVNYDSVLNDTPPTQLRLLKPTQSRYSSARKALTINGNYNLPGREKEIEELKSFIDELVSKRASGSLYISGHPGTGKTASLMKLMNNETYKKKIEMVYINCTSVATVSGIYKRIVQELELNCDDKSETGCLACIEDFLKIKHKMVMLVLDEVDFLVSQKQTVLYRIFEWPAIKNSRIIIVGIANALNLADRELARLSAKFVPRLMHYKPYTREQIIQIFRSRLEEGGVLDLFPATTIQLLAAKVAAVSGDVRRALDIGRRVIEIAEHDKSVDGIQQKIEAEIEPPTTEKPVQIKEVLSVVNSVYGTSQTLGTEGDDAFPLQQKLLICAVLLIMKNDKHKGITLGRLHDVYKKICTKRNLMALDQAEFTSLCSLVEVRGIIRLHKKKESRLSNVYMEWNEEEVHAAMKDKQLIAEILSDKNVLQKR